MSQTFTSPTSPNAPNQQGSTRLLMVALGVAVLAVILVNVYIGMVRSQAKAQTFTIYRLNRPMERGEEVEEDDLDPYQVPTDLRDSFQDAVERSDRTDTAEFVGETLRQPAQMNQILTYGLFRRNQSDNLQSKINPGMRLVALPVNSDILPAINPGSRVDIEAPFNVGGQGVRVLAVMENVHVLAVGRRSIIEQQEGDDRPSRNYDTISIQVTPSQATALSMIQRATVGDFELQVRNPGDERTPKIPAGGINPEVLEIAGVTPK